MTKARATKAKRDATVVVSLRIEAELQRDWQALADRLREGNVSMMIRLAVSELAERTVEKDR
jgi:hypothetical protein